MSVGDTLVLVKHKSGAVQVGDNIVGFMDEDGNKGALFNEANHKHVEEVKELIAKDPFDSVETFVAKFEKAGKRPDDSEAQRLAEEEAKKNRFYELKTDIQGMLGGVTDGTDKISFQTRLDTISMDDDDAIATLEKLKEEVEKAKNTNPLAAKKTELEKLIREIKDKIESLPEKYSKVYSEVFKEKLKNTEHDISSKGDKITNKNLDDGIQILKALKAKMEWLNNMEYQNEHIDIYQHLMPYWQLTFAKGKTPPNEAAGEDFGTYFFNIEKFQKQKNQYWTTVISKEFIEKHIEVNKYKESSPEDRLSALRYDFPFLDYLNVLYEKIETEGRENSDDNINANLIAEEGAERDYGWTGSEIYEFGKLLRWLN